MHPHQREGHFGSAHLQVWSGVVWCTVVRTSKCIAPQLRTVPPWYHEARVNVSAQKNWSEKVRRAIIMQMVTSPARACRCCCRHFFPLKPREYFP